MKQSVGGSYLKIPQQAAMSKDGQFLYVSEKYAQGIHIFKRDPTTGNISYARLFQLPIETVYFVVRNKRMNEKRKKKQKFSHKGELYTTNRKH